MSTDEEIKKALFMNVKTGEIIEKGEKILGLDVEIKKKPKSKCKKCFGRGYVGRAAQDGNKRGLIIVKGNLVPCRCVLKE